jgi:hypothetical protein
VIIILIAAEIIIGLAGLAMEARHRELEWQRDEAYRLADRHALFTRERRAMGIAGNG